MEEVLNDRKIIVVSWKFRETTAWSEGNNNLDGCEHEPRWRGTTT
jgi:hypothetical protein